MMPESRDVRIEYLEVGALIEAIRKDNPKRHDLGAIAASIRRVGFVTPVILNDTDGRLVAGAGRAETVALLRAEGQPAPLGVRVDPDGSWRIPVIRGVGLTPADASAFLIADNRTSELGGWDPRMLADLLQELSADAAGLAGTGFAEDELEQLLDTLAQEQPGLTDPDSLPAAPDETTLYVQPGDLWALGRHLVLCGDATLADDVQKLLHGRPVDLCVTDPPYNIDFGRHGGQAALGRAPRSIQNDHLEPDAWRNFVRAWVQNLLAVCDGSLYIFMSSKEWPIVAGTLTELGGHWSDTLIWVKDHFVLGRADYQRQYEAIWYGWREGTSHQWCGDRDQGDVWIIPRPAASDLHPMMKPVQLLERAIQNSSSLGARVLDPFLGSGSTLIAAEHLSRSCLGMEIDPRYVQVTIERWQAYAGAEAKLLSRGGIDT